ncbi:hypothetical protein [Xanthomonas arboricola]|uniref:hypothetical protein n=1 Tax=Xanthomonas arboricola TaxID=56448 RepID=UPI0032E93780
MSQLTLTVEMIVDIPSQPSTAKVIRVVNSLGQDITNDFTNHCSAQGLGISSQAEIESAIVSFTKVNQNNMEVLP